MVRGTRDLHCTEVATAGVVFCCLICLMCLKCADYSCVIHIIAKLFRNNSGIAFAIKILKIIPA